jgi:hypothetical protein
MERKYEIRAVEAWASDDGWTWNESFHLADFNYQGGDLKNRFLYELHKLGTFCKRGRCVVVDDGSVLELQDRKTGEPLYACLSINC